MNLHRQSHAVILDGDPTVLLVDVDLAVQMSALFCWFDAWGLGSS